MLSLSSVAYGQDYMKFPVDENPRYFPVGVFAVGKGDGEFTAGWYAEQLRALKEPSLLMDASAHKETVYHFTWLRTFNHPIAVRIVIHANGTGTLTSKMADGAGGYKPGKLITNTTRDIGASEVQHLLASIDAMGFWRMPAEFPFRAYTDGSPAGFLGRAPWAQGRPHGGEGKARRKRELGGRGLGEGRA